MYGSQLKERIHSFFTKGDGCWEWTHTKTPTGYGQLTFKGQHMMAHRAVYEIYRGAIPTGLNIDHLCKNTSCVNP